MSAAAQTPDATCQAWAQRIDDEEEQAAWDDSCAKSAVIGDWSIGDPQVDEWTGDSFRWIILYPDKAVYAWPDLYDDPFLVIECKTGNLPIAHIGSEYLGVAGDAAVEYKTGDTIKSETWPSTSYALDGETEIITFSNRAFESLKISDRFLIRYEAVYGMTDLAFNPGGLIDVLAEVPECEGSEAS